MIGRFRDPPRLADDPSRSGAEGLGALIERVQREAPDDETVAALFARIEPRIAEAHLAPPAPPESVERPQAVTARSVGNVPALVKGLVAMGVVGVIAAGALWSARPALVAEPAPVPPLVASPAQAPATEPVVAPEVIAGREPTPRPTARAASAARPHSGVVAPHAHRAPGVASPREAPKDASRPATDSEADLLQAALEALGAAPREALRLTDEHARRYPKGALTQEREVIAIEALVRIGRMASARLRAQNFLAAHPSTAHNARIEALLRGEPPTH